MIDDRHKSLLVFTDEIWASNSNDQMYISSIFIEESKFENITDKILNARYMTGSWLEDTAESWQDVDKESDYFEKNDERIKFSRMEGSANKREIAKRWMKLLKEEEFSCNFKIKILEVDMDRMNIKNFGSKDSDLENRIYSRLYRALLIGGSRYYFGKEKTISKGLRIFHDLRPRNQEDFEKIIDSLDKEEVEIDGIKYVNDNHREQDNEFLYRCANLIQFCDLLAGCTSKIFTEEKLGSDRMGLVQDFGTLVQDSRDFKPRSERRIAVDSFPSPEPDSQKLGESPNIELSNFYTREIVKKKSRDPNTSLKNFT